MQKRRLPVTNNISEYGPKLSLIVWTSGWYVQAPFILSNLHRFIDADCDDLIVTLNT